MRHADLLSLRVGLEPFTLLPDELVAIGNKSGATRLGFAVFLCS